MMAGSLLFALTSFAYLLASPFWPFLVVRVLQGIGLAFFNTAVFTLISNISPGIHRGQSLSYFFLAQNISLALAPSFGMFLIDEFGVTVLFLVCLGVSLLSLFIVSRLGRRQVLQLEGSSTGNGFFIHREVLPSSIVSFFFYFIWGALSTFFSLYALKNGVANPGLFFSALAITLILGRALGAKVLDLYRIERLILYFLTACVISMTVLAFLRLFRCSFSSG